MSADALQMVVIVLGSLAIIAGVIALWNITMEDAEKAEAERAAQRLRRELDRH